MYNKLLKSRHEIYYKRGYFMTRKANVISFINLKGGVGKTSSAINIADKLSEEHEVLVIDMDPQFNATQALLNYQYTNFENFIPTDISEKVKKDFDENYKDKNINSDEIKEEFKLKAQLIYQELKTSKVTVHTLFNKDSIISEISPPNLIYKIKNNLSLIPGDLDLFKSLSGDSVGKHNVLEDHFQKYSLREDYDYIIIDCPPNWTILTQSSIFASDYYIIPSKVDLFSSVGIGLLQNLVQSTFYDDKSGIYSTYSMFRKGINRGEIKPLGVLFTLTHDLVISKTIKQKLKKEIIDLEFLDSEIPYHQSVPLKFSLYSESGERHTSLTNALEKVTTEIKDIIKED